MTATSSNPGMAPSVDQRASVQFFFAAHLALLMVVLIGFGPTFYLRAQLGHHRPLPTILIVHGIILTGWFMLTVFQAWLMQTGRILWHRRTGYFAAGYAALVVAMGIVADARMASQIDSPH